MSSRCLAWKTSLRWCSSYLSEAVITSGAFKMIASNLVGRTKFTTRFLEFVEETAASWTPTTDETDDAHICNVLNKAYKDFLRKYIGFISRTGARGGMRTYCTRNAHFSGV